MVKLYSANDAFIRLIAFAITLALAIWLLFRQINGRDTATCATSKHKLSDNFVFEDMNRHIPDNKSEPGQMNGDRVLILTPFKEAAHHIDRYFNNINKLTYPHHLISLGFLVSDSQDDTPNVLHNHAKWFSETQQPPWQRFRSISILQKDFNYVLPNDVRHNFDVQIKRREIMSRSRNYLLTSTLSEDIRWVLWLDGDVFGYPETLLDDLIALNKDIVVPNCLWHTYNEEGGYDYNNWQETKESAAFLSTLKQEDVLLEGYREQETHRRLLINMRNEGGNTDLFHMVPLDGVGGTCLLVNAEVHRQGVIFPPFVYKHALETEGLAKMAKSMDFEVWGLPNYFVFHFV